MDGKSKKTSSNDLDCDDVMPASCDLNIGLMHRPGSLSKVTSWKWTISTRNSRIMMMIMMIEIFVNRSCVKHPMNISWSMWWKKFHPWRFLIPPRRLSKKFNLASTPEEGSFSNSSCLVENFPSKIRLEIYLGREWSGLYHCNIGNPSFAGQNNYFSTLTRNVSTSRYGESTMEWDWRHLRLTSQIGKSPFLPAKLPFQSRENCQTKFMLGHEGGSWEESTFSLL